MGVELKFAPRFANRDFTLPERVPAKIMASIVSSGSSISVDIDRPKKGDHPRW